MNLEHLNCFDVEFVSTLTCTVLGFVLSSSFPFFCVSLFLEGKKLNNIIWETSVRFLIWLFGEFGIDHNLAMAIELKGIVPQYKGCN